MAIRASYFSYGEVLFVLELHVHLFIPQPEIIFNPSSLCHLEIGCPQLLAKLFLNRSFHPACGNPLLNLLDDAFFRPSPVLLDLWMLFFFFFQRWVRRKMFERWQGQLPTILYDFLFVGHLTFGVWLALYAIHFLLRDVPNTIKDQLWLWLSLQVFDGESYKEVLLKPWVPLFWRKQDGICRGGQLFQFVFIPGASVGWCMDTVGFSASQLLVYANPWLHESLSWISWAKNLYWGDSWLGFTGS